MKKKRIVVFISGRGSNFKAIHQRILEGMINGEIVAVVSDNPDAKGLRYARDYGIDCAVFNKTKGESGDDYFGRIIELLDRFNPDLIALAGFMKVLNRSMVQHYRNRIINIHPALLPSFPGTDAQKQALNYGVKWTGCTVHFVDEGVDTGPIIFQEAVPVHDSDTVETLSARILEKEHILFPRAIQFYCDDRIVIDGRHIYIKER